MARIEQNVRLIELGVAHVNINARDQGLAIAALAQESARARVLAATPNALTDNSTGTDRATLVAVPTAESFAKDGVTSGAPKAGFDTLMGLVEDANEELLSKVNELIVLAAGNTARTIKTTAGAAADDTIAALADLTGATDNLVDAATGNAQIIVARNNQAAIAAGLNYVRVALGVATVADNSGGVFDIDADNYITTDAEATAAAITTNGDLSLTLASVNAAVLGLRNNVATLAAAASAMCADMEVGPFVVATSSPRTRFLIATNEINEAV